MRQFYRRFDLIFWLRLVGWLTKYLRTVVTAMVYLRRFSLLSLREKFWILQFCSFKDYRGTNI